MDINKKSNSENLEELRRRMAARKAASGAVSEGNSGGGRSGWRRSAFLCLS